MNGEDSRPSVPRRSLDRGQTHTTVLTSSGAESLLLRSFFRLFPSSPWYCTLSLRLTDALGGMLSGGVRDKGVLPDAGVMSDTGVSTSGEGSPSWAVKISRPWCVTNDNRLRSLSAKLIDEIGMAGLEDSISNAGEDHRVMRWLL